MNSGRWTCLPRVAHTTLNPSIKINVESPQRYTSTCYAASGMPHAVSRGRTFWLGLISLTQCVRWSQHVGVVSLTTRHRHHLVTQTQHLVLHVIHIFNDKCNIVHAQRPRYHEQMSSIHFLTSTVPLALISDVKNNLVGHGLNSTNKNVFKHEILEVQPMSSPHEKIAPFDDNKLYAESQ